MNGTNDSIYGCIQLNVVSTLAPGEILMIQGASLASTGWATTTKPDGFLHNGTDAVALYTCPTCTDAANDFPVGYDYTRQHQSGNPIFTTDGGHTATLLQTLIYDTNDADDLGLWNIFLNLSPYQCTTLTNFTLDQVNESDGESIRLVTFPLPDGNVYSVGSATPGVIEASVIPVTAAVWLFGSGLLGLIGIARR